MDSRKIAIIMPVKNAALYLKECIESIINQTYTNWNIFAVNDNSTDNSLTILDNYAKKEARIKVFTSTGVGIIDALKMGYKNAEGNLITRMDADDIMPLEKLKMMASFCISNNVVTGKVKYIAENELREGYIYYQNWLNKLVITNTQYTEIYKECVIPSPCWMMDRQTFDKIGAFNSEVYPEDYDLTFRMYKHQLKIIGIDKVLHIWRDYNERTSRNDANYSDNSFLEIKINYFLQIDYDCKQQLVIWGVGKKGKTLAKLLLAKQIEFCWVTDNPNRIGKDVYGIKIEHQSTVLQSKIEHQIIILVANKNEQKEIKKVVNLNYKLHDFWFC